LLPALHHREQNGKNAFWYQQQEAQLMLTTGSTRLAVNQGQQT